MVEITTSAPARTRRGVLLLVVLSMLTLFLMLGAAYLAIATRSRDIARAFGRLTLDAAEAQFEPVHFLDAALLTVLRGGTTVQLSGTTLQQQLLSGTANFRFESLLADRYGQNQTLRGTATITGTTAPLYTASLTLPGSTHPALLNGRILTFCPVGGDATSHRILQATGTSGTYQVTLGPPHGRFALPPVPAGSRVIVNGHEFAANDIDNEEFDGFDMARNPFMAYLSIGELASQSMCNKMSFIRPLNLGAPDDARVQYETDPDTMLPFVADNDNDGEPDGVFLDFGFPKLTTAGGQEIQLDASVLIVDLDSRFNVNAHGSLAPRLYDHLTAQPHPGWTTGSNTYAVSGTAPFGAVSMAGNAFIPLGSGYGPPETSERHLKFSRTFRFSDPENPTSGQDPWMFSTAGGGTACQTGVRGYGSRFSINAPTPRVPAVFGRLGGDPPASPAAWVISGTTLAGISIGRPGKSGTNDSWSRAQEQLIAHRSGTTNTSSGTYGIAYETWWSGTVNTLPGPVARATYNSPPDLHGRLKVYTEISTGCPVPTLSLAKPEWSSETVDDPYEIRLGEGARRCGPAVSGTAQDDVPFTYGELERILRPYDIDSQSLPTRLAAALGSAGEEGRLLLTTDSWDTTLITGSAARNIRNWMSGLPRATVDLYGTTGNTLSPVSGIVAGDVARGEKFDLSRPLSPSTSGPYAATTSYYLQRQAYFKDLYTLLCALSGTATAPANHRSLAQWAANVVEFVDADSTMTPFEYDRDPTNGWTVDGDLATTGESHRETVFGAERPELLITEAYAWQNPQSGTNGLLLALHRPWASKGFSRTSGTNHEIPGEACDPDLAVSGTSDILDLGKRAPDSGFPIWRIRVTSGSSVAIIRFDDSTNATSGTNSITEYRALASGTLSPKVGPNTSLLVYGTAAYRNDDEWRPISMHSGTTGPNGPTVVIATTSPTLLRLPTNTTGSVDVYLERLTDPTGKVEPAQWNANLTATPAQMASGTASVTLATPMYRIVDSVTCAVDSINGNGGPSTKKKLRQTSNPSTSFWKSDFADAVVGTFGSGISSATNAAWFHWPNRPLISPMELLLVRNGDAATWLDSYERFSSGSNSLRTLDPSLQLMSAAYIPTRFAGIHTSIPANGWSSTHENLTGIYSSIRGISHLSAYREPGRTNLNTIVGYTDPLDSRKMQSDVWNSVVAGPLPSPPTAYDSTRFAGRIRRKLTQPAMPAQPKLGLPATPAVPGRGNKKQDETNVADPAVPGESLAATILSISGTDTYISTTTSGSTVTTSTNTLMQTAIDRNPWHGIYTAMRLANTTTVRSNVFGVWVTLRQAVPGDPSSVQIHRAFYIVDRSIPVGFEAGKDHNVRDTIRLRRIIE